MPSAQFRKIFVDRAQRELDSASAAVNEATKYVSPPPSSKETTASSRASSLLSQLKTCGTKWGRISAFDLEHEGILSCIEGKGGDEKTEWILDQLEIVGCARKLVKILNISEVRSGEERKTRVGARSDCSNVRVCRSNRSSSRMPCTFPVPTTSGASCPTPKLWIRSSPC